MSDADWARHRAQLTQAIVAGLDDGAASYAAAAEAKARSTFPGQTTATFAGIYAVVEGAGVDSSSIVARAVAAVEERNPAHVSVESEPGPPTGVIRMIGSVPTDYIDKLEADASHAFLARTLDEQAPAIAAAIEAAARGAV